MSKPSEQGCFNVGPPDGGRFLNAMSRIDLLNMNVQIHKDETNIVINVLKMFALNLQPLNGLNDKYFAT